MTGVRVKQVEEQTFYEILEVGPDAPAKEIQRAYEHAMETFHADSIAIYTLFSEDERIELQRVIEEAYRVLIDEELRRQYDQTHSPKIEKLSRDKEANVSVKLLKKKENLSFTGLSMDVGEGVYRGSTLKQIRESLGIDLKTIAMETKINFKILEWIEEEALDRLPAMVYLKGFLKAYAQILNIDPQKLIEGYLGLFQQTGKK